MMTFWQGLCHLPISLHPTIGKFCGKLLLILAKSRKNIAQANIETCFPNLSKTEQQKKDIEDGIRGAMLTHLSKEIPYMTKINIREIKQVKHILHIHVDIVTDRASRKKLLIGKNGDMIKKIGQTARLSLETRWQTPVFLKTFILVDSS